MGIGLEVLLSQTEIDNVDLFVTLSDSHEEVVGLDVTMDEGLGVDVLDTRDGLVGQGQDGLQRELAVAGLEQVLQAGSEEIETHDVVFTPGSEPVCAGDSDTAGQRLVDTGLIIELGVLGLDGLELDGDLLAGDDVGAEMDVAATAAANLAADAILVISTEILFTTHIQVSHQYTRYNTCFSEQEGSTTGPEPR